MNSPPLRQFLVVLFLVAFVFNWPWEMLQMPAYVGMAGRTWWETAVTCALASLGDAFVTLLIYAAGMLWTRQPWWAFRGGWRAYLIAALLGALSAIVIEWEALSQARWTYTKHMPTVPALGTGLWPLAQLALLAPAAIRIAVWWFGDVTNRSDDASANR